MDQKALLQAAKAQVAMVMDNAIAEINNVEPGEDDVFYVEPIQDPYQKAISYLEKHNILQLFQNLTASIVYTKPDKPLEFMMHEVEKIKKLQNKNKEIKN
ncbi:hypothetical protein CHS0354_020179 [Potamilus streckersoni]|uniref:Uncharacterized protein n=1 Tax=Potamilus streckersoni TaxID=2493646 RepID=A0AAE0SK13_9BIVA|nr:hypothetical protein CHS0354_020179 [Potamilus streckersoni]